MPRYGGILGKRNRYTTVNTSGIWDIPDSYSSKINLGVGTDIVTNGLQLFLDAGNPGRSPSTTWEDISGNNRHFTASGTPTQTIPNTFNLTNTNGWYRLGAITNVTNATLVMFIKTQDTQALFASGTDLSDGSGNFYVAAYNSGNQLYYGTVPTANAFSNLVPITSMYTTIQPVDTWRMIEFKNMDISAWNNWKFNMYGSFNFDSGQIGAIMMYNRTLSAAESEQNLRALGPRYGITAGSSTLAFSKASCYVSFNGTRGANYAVDYSTDGTNWTQAWTGNMSSTTCGFLDGTGGGSNYGSYRYWRYRFTSNTSSHHPRVSRLILTTTTGQAYDIIKYANDNCADSGGIPGLQNPSNIVFDTLNNATVSGF